MKFFISLIILQFISSSVYCSDSIFIKASVKYDLKGSFFDCKRNDFLAMLDTSRQKGSLQENLSDISIAISSGTVNFSSKYKQVSYRLIKYSSTIFFFESTKRSLARAISECNRERFFYYLKVDLEKNSIKMVYDMSEFKKNDLLVFEGKLSQFCGYNSINK